MYRKLAFSVASILGLMTMIVSAQQPGSQVPSSSGAAYEPLQVPSIGVQHRSRREESDLIHKSQELVKQFAKAEGENKDKIKDQLRDTIDKQFDIRQKRHEAELKALEDQVKKLKDMVQKRKEARRDIVGKRLEQLVRDAEGLGW